LSLVASFDSLASFDVPEISSVGSKQATLKITQHALGSSPMEIEIISADVPASPLAKLKVSFFKVEPKVAPSSLAFVVGSPDVARLLTLTAPLNAAASESADVGITGLERKGTPNTPINENMDLFTPSTTGISRGAIANRNTLTLNVASGGPSAPAAKTAFILKTSALTFTSTVNGGSLTTTAASSDAYPGAEFSVEVARYSLDLKKGGSPLTTYPVQAGVALTAADSFDVTFSPSTVTPVLKISDNLTLTNVDALSAQITWNGITLAVGGNRVRLSGTPTASASASGTRKFSVYAQGNGGAVLASKDFSVEIRTSATAALSFKPASLSDLVRGEYAYREVNVSSSSALTGLRFGNGLSTDIWNGLTLTILSSSSFKVEGVPTQAIQGSIRVNGVSETGATVATGILPISVSNFSGRGKEGTALNRYPFVNGTRVTQSPFVVDSETLLTLSFLVDGVGVRGPLTALLIKQEGGQVYLNATPSFGTDNGSVLVRLPELPPSWYTLYLSYTQGGTTYYQQFYFRAGEAGGGSTKKGGGGGCSTTGLGFAALALVGLLRKKP
jgi:hypothetical protein